MSTYTLDISQSMIRDARDLAFQTINASTYPEFKEKFLTLNATVRGYKRDNGIGFREHDEEVSFRGNTIWIAPEPKSLDALFELAWNKSQEFGQATERAGYLYHAIYSIHVCKNGNGRSARSLYYCENNDGVAFKDLVWTQNMQDGSKIFGEIGFTVALV